MELPKTRSIFLNLAIAVTLYLLLLPAWFSIRPAYKGSVTSAVTSLVLPAFRLQGSVTPAPGNKPVLVYTLPSPVHKVWGRVQQRLLDTADLPLALAAAAGLGFLGWRKRLMVGVIGVAMLWVAHAGLVSWTAIRLATILADPEIPAAALDRLLHTSAEGVGAWRDVSAGVVVVVMGSLAALAAGARTPRKQSQ